MPLSFEKDNLSVLQPRYETCNDAAERARVMRLFGAELGIAADDFLLFRMVLGSPTSQKLRIESGGQRWFAKVRTGAEGEAILRHELAGTRLLSSHSVPSPVLLGGDEGALFSHGNDHGLLQLYVDGHYFDGRPGQFAPAINAFVAIARALAIGPAPIRADAADFNTDFLAAIPALVEAGSEQGLFKLLPAHAAARIIDALALVQAASDSYRDIQPLHLDFHPQNLLYREARLLSVLDFEWLVPYPVAAGNGFAAYKLIRQGLALDTLATPDVPRILDNWLRTWNADGPGSQINLDALRVGALLRVLYLIWKILDGILVRSDQMFLADLPKQVRALTEIPQIFAIGHHDES